MDEEKIEKDIESESGNIEETDDDELLSETIEIEAVSVTEAESEPESEESEEKTIQPEKRSEMIEFGEFQLKDAVTLITLVVIPRLLVIGAIICYFFNFMSVTYGGKLTEVTGKDLIFGGVSISLKAQGSAGYYADGDMFNWLVMLSAVAALGALFGRSREAYKCGIVSAGLLIVFRFTAEIYYQVGEMTLEEYEENGWMLVEFGKSQYIAAALLITAAVWYFVLAVIRHKKMHNKYWRQ